MHQMRLIQTFLKINLQIAIAYRVDTVINLLINLMWLGWELLGLHIIFSNTDTLAGWRQGDLIALLGVFRMVNVLMASMIWPATEKFNESVRDGSFDYTLIQPVNSLFIITFSRITIWRAWDMVLAIALITIGIQMSGGSPDLLSLIAFLMLLTSGTLVVFSLWVVMIALTFWFVKFDNNVTIIQALLDAGRYPVTVYPSWLRVIVTYLIPIALATTIPLQALRSELDILQILLFLAVGMVAFRVSLFIWKVGVRRYNGASS